VFVFRAVKELLFNITKHAGVEKALVELSSTDRDFVITVSDQGKGFDSEVLKPTAAIYGLGLLSIRERVRHIGGDLIIESAPGRGSSFKIIVPVDTKAELKQQTKSDIYHRSAGFNSIDIDKKGGIRVLFVDDHKVIRQGLIQLTAKQANINVVGEASNGIEAIEKARQLQPGLIIMDVSMPLMDGIEATKKIKAEMPHIRVIGLSMFEDEHVLSAMRQAGAEAFIRKTASSAELLKAIFSTGILGSHCYPT
jgi:CheY-like chemotaxis protein